MVIIIYICNIFILQATGLSRKCQAVAKNTLAYCSGASLTKEKIIMTLATVFPATGDSCECGRLDIGRIIGGTEAKRNEFFYQV
jgi:hypothetical protein